METSYLKTLELDKIIARAAEGCVCKESREKLLAIEPQCDPDEVRYALEQTDAINSLLIKNGSPRFGGVEGVSQLAARAVKGGVLSMGELLMVAGALRNFQNLVSWYGSSEHDALPTDDLFYALAPQPGLEQQISSAILAPDAMADTASHTLNDLRKKIRATENSIRDRLESMVRNMDTSKYLQESVVSIRNGRYVVPVKSEYRGEVSGIIHDVSSTGATVFVEPQAVVEANARILQYRAQEAQEIERILVAFTGQVAAIEPQFQYSYKAMLEIDVLLAKARLALDMKAFKPTVRTDTSFSLIRARHPLIDAKKCVPVDISLGREYDSLIITGPNTGGKTVSLKTLGLLTLMTQCGLHIPAGDRSEVSVYERVLADIGDEQSIEQSLSTFSAHMKTIVEILQEADRDSLILFDELGAGTDPVEGAALAIAIIQHVRALGARAAATTHYAELKTFAMTTPGVENASCEFNVETLSPTYRLLIGIPGKSNAFAISRRLGLPDEVITNAQSQMSKDSVRFEDVLTQLEAKRQALEKREQETDRLYRQREEDARKAREFREQMQRAKENARSRGEAEAKRILRDARFASDAVFAELERMRKEQAKADRAINANEARAELRRQLNEAEDAIDKRDARSEPIPKPSRPIQKGDLVEIPGVSTPAEVVSVGGDGTLQLKAGILKMKAKADEVRLIEDDERAAMKKKAPKPTRTAVTGLRTAASRELDIRGMETLEAESVVETFLSTAVMGHLETVTIIHGKGTGALRNAVHDILRRNKNVKSFRLGVYGEGENGITVVTMK